MHVKKIVSLLVVTMLLLHCIPTSAFAEDKEVFGTLNAIFWNSGGQIEEMDVLERDNHLYVKATYLAEKFGYECHIQINGEHGDTVCFAIREVGRVIIYQNQNEVVYINSAIYAENFTAPCGIVVAKDTVWVPFHYTLKLMDSDCLITSGLVNIREPADTALGVYFERVAEQIQELEFNLMEEFGTNELVANLNHLINVYDGLLSLDPSSYGQLFTGILGDSTPYDFKYADEIAALFCTSSQEQIRELTEYTSSVYDWIDNDGTLANYMEHIDEGFSRDIDRYAELLDDLMAQENPNTYRASKVSDMLDDIADKSGRWDRFSGPIKDIQNALTPADSVSDIVTFGSFGLDLFSYYREFDMQDSTALSILEVFTSNIQSANSYTSETSIAALNNYINISKSGPEGIAAYSMAKALLNDISRTSDMTQFFANQYGISTRDLSQFLFGSTGSLLLAGWDLAKNIVPFIRDGLSGADKCEAALYTQILHCDAGLWMSDIRRQLGERPDDPALQREFAQSVFAHLKLSLVGRELALDMVSDLPSAVENADYLQQLRSKNEEIAKLLAIYSSAVTENTAETMGFTRSAEEEFKQLYDDSYLIAAMDKKPDIPLEGNNNSIVDDALAEKDELYTEFLASEGYLPYFESTTVPTGYAILDIDQNSIPELIIQSDSGMEFSYFVVFRKDVESNNIIPLQPEGFYNGGQIAFQGLEYSAKAKALIFRETRPYYVEDFPIGEFVYGAVSENMLQNTMSVGIGHIDGQNNSNYYYVSKSGFGHEIISEEEFYSYLIENTSIEFAPLHVDNMLDDSDNAKLDLMKYLNTDLYKFIGMFEDMTDDGATDGYQFSNAEITVCANYQATSFDPGPISYISIESDCEYSIAGIEYGMPLENVYSLMSQNATIESRGTMRVEFTHKSGARIVIWSDNGSTVSGISIWSAIE